MSSKELCLKDNNKTAHWVGRSKNTIPRYIIYFERRRVIDDIQASLTGTMIKKSSFGRKKNPYLLQEAEEQEAEEENADADVTAEANKIYEDDDGMIISMKEYQKTLEYQ